MCTGVCVRVCVCVCANFQAKQIALTFSDQISPKMDLGSNVNISGDFAGRFSACFGGRPHGRFSNLRFGVTLTFKLIAGF